MALTGKKVLVGLTGGIACYKVPYLIRDLVRNGAAVKVIMTKAATRFITPLTLETVSNNPVVTDLFPTGEFVATRHIELAEWPDLIVVAPATANCIGKIASGVSDDLLTTVICASARPVMLAPAMNPQMWANPVTRRNVDSLAKLGYRFVGPEEGDMACEHEGMGRMSEPAEIFAAVKAALSSSKKKARKN